MKLKSKKTGRVFFVDLDGYQNLVEIGLASKFLVIDNSDIQDRIEPTIPMEIEEMILFDFDKMTKAELKDLANKNNIDLESTTKRDIINELKSKL